MNSFSKQNQSGFALLLTMIVISVVLAIGLSLLNITLKQYTLSATARDSEVAFHMANTGLDCLRYHRARAESAFLSNSGPSVSCGGSASRTPTPISVGGGVYGHRYSFDVSTGGGNSCMEVSLYTASAETEAIVRPLANEGLEEFRCVMGNTCTVIFSRGFNRGCSEINSVRTVQRELTVTY